MGEVKKGNHIMKLFNWLRGLFRETEWTPHGKVWVDLDDAPEWTDEVFARAEIRKDGKVVREASGTFVTSSPNQLRNEIDRLRRNKKKHSHLQKELDALIDSGADT